MFEGKMGLSIQFCTTITVNMVSYTELFGKEGLQTWKAQKRNAALFAN